jgi:MED6 mediator sub complex component
VRLTYPPVHLYFINSPFCLDTSNNKVQHLHINNDINAGNHPELIDVLKDRAKWEAHVKKVENGLDFYVDGPASSAQPYNPLWVIRGYNKRVQYEGQGNARRKVLDEKRLVRTNYAIGDRIYQAASLGDIVASRLVRVFDGH